MWYQAATVTFILCGLSTLKRWTLATLWSWQHAKRKQKLDTEAELTHYICDLGCGLGTCSSLGAVTWYLFTFFILYPGSNHIACAACVQIFFWLNLDVQTPYPNSLWRKLILGTISEGWNVECLVNYIIWKKQRSNRGSQAEHWKSDR